MKHTDTRRKEIKPAELAELIRENMMYCAGTFYKYDDGCYRVVSKRMLKNRINDILTNKFYTKRKAEDAIDTLANKTEIKLKDLNPRDYLNLKNGLFDPMNCVLHPHTPEYYSTVQLNVKYSKDAKCELWLKTINEIFEGDMKKIEAMQEYFGLCLTRETKYRQALICVGEGRNGKSKMIEALENIIGAENRTAIALEQLNNGPAVAALFGKLLNASIETNAKSTVYDSIFKAIVSGDSIQANPKYKDPFSFRPFCKLIIATNTMPRVDDKTDAFFDRLLIVRFNRRFAESEENNELDSQLALEYDGIFKWCIEGLKRLQKRNRFEKPPVIQSEVDEYRIENNPVMLFIDDAAEIGPMHSVQKGDMYSAYVKWCRDNGHKPASHKRFAVELKRAAPSVIEKRTMKTRRWEGINLIHDRYDRLF